MRTNLAAEICKCKGCSQIKICDQFNMDSFYVYGCPCRTCLLKMLCQDTCDDYNKHSARVYRDNNFIRIMKKKKRELRVAYNKNILRGKYS